MFSDRTLKEPFFYPTLSLVKRREKIKALFCCAEKLS